jgi:hypothetical protein
MAGNFYNIAGILIPRREKTERKRNALIGNRIEKCYLQLLDVAVVSPKEFGLESY